MPRPAVIVAYGLPVIILLLILILNLRDAFRGGWSSTEWLAFFGALVLLGGFLFVTQAMSKHSQKSDNAEVAHLQSVFGALADQIGLTLYAPPPYQHPLGHSHGIFPHAKGTYRGHVVEVDVNYSEFIFEIVLSVQPRVGDRWPKAKLVRRGDPPPWLSPAGREVVRRLLAADRRTSVIDALELSPTELRCAPRDVTGKVVRIEGMKVGVLDPLDLREILDDLILFAETLPS